MNIKIIDKGRTRIYKTGHLVLKPKDEGELLVITIISDEVSYYKEKVIPKNFKFRCKKIDEERVRAFLKGNNEDGNNVLKIEKDYSLVFSFCENI